MFLMQNINIDFFRLLLRKLVDVTPFI